MRLKDANLLEVLISTTIDIALKAGVMEAKVNRILQWTERSNWCGFKDGSNWNVKGTK